MNAAISAALSVVRTALSPVTDGLLESWASSTELCSNMDALKLELLYAQGMLDNAQDRDIRSPALRELLHMLQELAYGADDALDELDYFRIQDELHGTYHAGDLDAQGSVNAFILNARHTAIAATNKLKPSSRSRDDASTGDPDDQDDGGCEISSSPAPATNQGVQVAQGGCMPKVVTSARKAVHTIGLCHEVVSAFTHISKREGLWLLVTQGCLTQLRIYGIPKFFTGTSSPKLGH